jgi:putative addiction module killer protein
VSRAFDEKLQLGLFKNEKRTTIKTSQQKRDFSGGDLGQSVMPVLRTDIKKGRSSPTRALAVVLAKQKYLDLIASGAKVTRTLIRLEQGNFSNVKSVGEGVFEYRINFGPGYRIYFEQDRQALVILFTGGTKKRQQRDIDEAQIFWREYKQSKRGQR